MVKKPAKQCECIELLKPQLAEENCKLDIPLSINFKTGRSGPQIPTICVTKIDTKIRKRLPLLVCTHCPFCGVKYPE